MSKVIVINDNGQNFKDLESYGDILCLTKGLINLSDIRVLSFNIREKLAMIEEDDFIVLTGPALISIIVCHYILNKFNKIKILSFHKKSLRYVIQEIKASEIIE